MSRVSLAATAAYLPERWMTAAEVGARSGIPEQVIVEKFGLRGKHIAAAADIAHRAGALLGVDSTVATPVLTRPIEHGADIVMHSATKYLNGHSDIIAGALVCIDGAAV